MKILNVIYLKGIFNYLTGTVWYAIRETTATILTKFSIASRLLHKLCDMFLFFRRLMFDMFVCLQDIKYPFVVP